MVYDAPSQRLQRTFQQAHTQRIGSLAWSNYVLTSGSRDKKVHHYDVREATQTPFRASIGHRQEVCGLKWSTSQGANAACLASGGNDNKVCIWDLRGSQRASSAGGRGASGIGVNLGEETSDTPLWKFHEHTAAVKALAWDPHMPNLLATGGGTQDKHIRFWNTSNGKMLSKLDTGSQVCSFDSFDISVALMSSCRYAI